MDLLLTGGYTTLMHNGLNILTFILCYANGNVMATI